MAGRAEKVAVVVPLLGVAAFGLYYSWYSEFFSQFGVTPEQVGVSWPQALARIALVPLALAAVAAVLLVVALVLPGMLAVTLALPALLFADNRRRLRGLDVREVHRRWVRPVQRLLPPLVAWFVGGVMVLFDTAYEYRFGDDVRVASWATALLYVLVSWAGLLALGLLSRTRARVLFWGAGIGLLWSATYLAGTQAADEAAQAVRDRGEWSIVSAALGIAPQYVDVHWHADEVPAIDGTQLLLGVNASVYVLFDCGSGRVSFIEAQNISLTGLSVPGESALRRAWDACSLPATTPPPADPEPAPAVSPPPAAAPSGCPAPGT